MGQVKKERKKIYCFDPSYLIPNRKFRKKEKKIQKIEKHHSGFISSQNGLGQVANEREKKIIVPILPTRPRIENSEKNGKKIKKIENHHLGFN